VVECSENSRCLTAHTTRRTHSRFAGPFSTAFVISRGRGQGRTVRANSLTERRAAPKSVSTIEVGARLIRKRSPKRRRLLQTSTPRRSNRVGRIRLPDRGIVSKQQSRECVAKMKRGRIASDLGRYARFRGNAVRNAGGEPVSIP
jgi:hypothetical protein